MQADRDRSQVKPAQDRPETERNADVAVDPRAEVRAHVATARSWAPEEASRQATADLTAYHAPRASRPGDAHSMQQLREDMALRARNSEPYRLELQALDPKTLRDVLAQPIAAPSREGESKERPAPSPAQAPETPESTKMPRAPEADLAKTAGQPVNMISAVSERTRTADTELDAQQRLGAKASIAANDRQGDAKREVVDHMAPDELKRFAAAGADKPKAGQVLRDAASREERAATTGPVREPVPPLSERFNIGRRIFTKEYEFRDRPGTVAFSERFGNLRTAHSTPAVAIAMVDRAGERGWSTVRVSGSAEFKRQSWIAAEARGIKAIGYEPTKGDIEAARAERDRLARSTDWRGGSIEKVRDRAIEPVAPAVGERNAGRTSDRSSERSVERTDATPTVPAAATTGDPKRQVDREVNGTAREAGPREATARDSAAPDIPSLAGSSARRDDQDQSQPKGNTGRGPNQRDEPGRGQDRDADQRLGRSVGSAAFMRALEQVMERDNVPQQLRPEIRTVAAAQFAALQGQSKTVRVRLVDRQAPRQVPVQLPRYEVKHASQERAR